MTETLTGAPRTRGNWSSSTFRVEVPLVVNMIALNQCVCMAYA
jgi:hypothetical protein